MTGKWDHSTKPSKFVVIDNGKEIYRGGFSEGYKIIEAGKDNLLKQIIIERDEAQNEIIGWKNKWECAVEMAARAEIERDDARAELSLKCQTVTISEQTISDLLKKSERLEKQIQGLNNFANERFEEIQRVRNERDEARAVAYDLAVVASHCLGWHDHESKESAERISSVLKKWREIKSSQNDIT
jgi:tellurite resistance protein